MGWVFAGLFVGLGRECKTVNIGFVTDFRFESSRDLDLHPTANLACGFQLVRNECDAAPCYRLFGALNGDGFQPNTGAEGGGKIIRVDLSGRCQIGNVIEG